MQTPRPSGGGGDIPLEVTICDSVMQYEPDCRKHLSGDGDQHLHPALSPHHRLVVGELGIEAVPCPGRAPGALNDGLP